MKTFKDYEHDSGRQMEKEKKPKPEKDHPAREAPKVKTPPEQEGVARTAPKAPEPVGDNTVSPSTWPQFQEVTPAPEPEKKPHQKPVKPVVDPGKVAWPEPSPEPKQAKAHVPLAPRLPKHDKVVERTEADQVLPSNSEETGRRF